MTARRLVFTGIEDVGIERCSVPVPGNAEVRVETELSAISAGTERLIYRGDAPTDLPADETIDALEGDLSFPLPYGYAAVGRIAETGEGVDDDWLGRRVFAYNPHESCFVAPVDDLVPVPDAVSTESAALFANGETAVTLVLDGQPTVGERVAVFGTGVVGLLATALLARFPIDSLVAVDPLENRRRVAEAVGADRAIDPSNANDDSAAAVRSAAGGPVDLAYEASGDPDALDDAIAATGFDGRVIVASWYGTKPATLDLGGRFHRDRIEVRSSQVSTIAPRHAGRWTHARRREVAWSWLERLDLEALFTHEFPLERADEAYRLLEERPGKAIQVLLTYGREVE